MLRRTVIGCLVVALGPLACAVSYSSVYKRTNSQIHPAPVASAQVKVVKSRNDLVTQWTEIGVYRGHAPTVEEAMRAAKLHCGNEGASFFILNTAPYASGSVWRVDGICAAPTAAARQ